MRRLKVALACRGVPYDFCEYIAHQVRQTAHATGRN